jgi:hypothetical protein
MLGMPNRARTGRKQLQQMDGTIVLVRFSALPRQAAATQTIEVFFSACARYVEMERRKSP